MRRLSYVYLLGAFLLLHSVFFQSCSQTVSTSSVEAKVSAIDGRGKEITLPKEADRIIVLYESLVDNIFILQAQKKLVGVPQQIYLNDDSFNFLAPYDRRFANKKIATPTFGGGSSNVEAVIGLQPDLVITFDNDIDAIGQLEGLGVPVFAVSSKDREAILDELKGIGALIGKSKRAEYIASLVEEQIEQMQGVRMLESQKVYYAWSKGRVLSTSGKGTLMDMAITLSGAQNACPLELEAPNVGAETLYKWNPDLIILWNSNVNDVYELSELASLPAVANKQVYVMKPSIYYDPHTVKFTLFAKQIRNWCDPVSYPDSVFRKDVQNMLTELYTTKNQTG